MPALKFFPAHDLESYNYKKKHNYFGIKSKKNIIILESNPKKT